MDGLPTPTNGVGSCQTDVQINHRTAASSQIVPSPPKQSQPRPKTSHSAFRESSRWAKRNAEWIDNGNTNVQHTVDRRRASEDLLRSHTLPAASTRSETELSLHHRSVSSDAEPLAKAHNLNCLSSSLSTGNWLHLRGNHTHRKLHVHHQLGRLVRKITDTSNWASKEPTASLKEPEEPKESDSVAQAASNPKTGESATGYVAKLNKKPGMDNIRRQKGAAGKRQEKSMKLNAEAITSLNAAGDTLKDSGDFPSLCEQDLEDTKRRSADLREVLSKYHSDRHGNLLPEINTDDIGDFSGVAQQQEQPVISSAMADISPRDEESGCKSKQTGGHHLNNKTAWKASSPSSGTSISNVPLLPPQPGPRISSRHGQTVSPTVRWVNGSALAGGSGLFAAVPGSRNESPDSVAMVVLQPEIAALNQQNPALHLPNGTSLATHSVFGSPPEQSTDTLTAITVQTLGNNKALTPLNSTDTDSVTLQPPARPRKLHSGFVSSSKAPSDAPNRPLPDLPEVPSPRPSEKMRRDADSRASSRSRRSTHRNSTQPGQTRKTPSLISHSSSSGGLHVSSSGSVKKSGNIRSSSQKRASDSSHLADAASPGLAPVEMVVEVMSPDLGQRQDHATLAAIRHVGDTLHRDQRIHEKRLKAIASARARRRNSSTRRDRQRFQEGPAAEDFPPPPSSRPSSRATVDGQQPEPTSRQQASDSGVGYLPNSIDLERSQPGNTSPAPNHPLPASQPRVSQITNSRHSPGASLVPAASPPRAPVSISSVPESSTQALAPDLKHSPVNLRSNANVTRFATVHETQTPPLSESSTQSSDGEGTGVVGATTANRANTQRRLHLSSSELAAMVANMRGQLDAQTRQIKAQSKQIRAIEMHKLRMVDAIDALIAVLSEPNTGNDSAVGSIPRKQERGWKWLDVDPNVKSDRADGGPDGDSILSASTTIESARSGSSASVESHAPFITEPNPFDKGGRVESVGSLGQESVGFNMDFDRMHELIGPYRNKGKGREGKVRLSRRERSGDAIGWLSIDT